MLTKEQSDFLHAVLDYESLKKDVEEARAKLEESMLVLGFNTYVQDPGSGLVYKIVKPNGTFVHFKNVEYVRTAKEGERAGTMSKKEAEGAGFVLSK